MASIADQSQLGYLALQHIVEAMKELAAVEENSDNTKKLSYPLLKTKAQYSKTTSNKQKRSLSSIRSNQQITHEHSFVAQSTHSICTMHV